MRFFGRMLGAAAVLASLAAGMALPASAQSPSIQKYGEPDKAKTPADIAAEKEAERAYQRSLGNIPAKQNVDPWGTVRSESAPPKAAAKTTDKAATAKPKAKSADSKTDGAAKQ